MRELVFATHNLDKVRELKEILNDYKLLTLSDIGFFEEIEENGTSFSENALIKARAVNSFCGLSVVADDSGLCVDALGGEPGIYSARYAGPNATAKDNNRKLIEMLKVIPEQERGAKFVCAAAVVFEDKTEAAVTGFTNGNISFVPRGEGGFGYDPYFIVDETGLTYSEMTEEQKNTLSHRKRAFMRLTQIIEEHYKQKP